MMSTWEIIAVCLSITYIILAMRENRFCFVAGFFATCIFTQLFFNAKLYMETGLQVYYALLSVYGWWQWQPGTAKKEGLEISCWGLNKHLTAISIIIILSSFSAIFLTNFTQATYPFFDSIVTWGSLVATFMVTRKILENWLYWVVLDSIGMYLYFNKALYVTAGLFAAYVILAILGHFRWLKTYRLQSSTADLGALELDTGI